MVKRATKSVVKPTTSKAKSAPKFAKQAEVSEDQLKVLRSKARELRDIDREIEDVQTKLSDLNSKKQKMQFEELPELLNKAGVDHVGLPAEGNLPAYDAKLKPYYRANIAADWEPERRQKAFDYLIKSGNEDLIKTTITIRLGRGDHKLLATIKRLLKPVMKKLDFAVDMAVQWNTLTSFLKNQIEVEKEVVPLETLGASVGEIVELKPRKEKRNG